MYAETILVVETSLAVVMTTTLAKDNSEEWNIDH